MGFIKRQKFSKTHLLQVHFFMFLLLMCNISLHSKISQNNHSSPIYGFGFFEKIIGQWAGPVISHTPAGNFDVWYVDFRPISESQVSQFSIMDAYTINYTSFFVVKHNQQLKIAMRTEGVFMNKGCVTYEVMDSVDEKSGYYRFSDFQAGAKRAYTEFIFSDNKLTMQTFTNLFNKQPTTSLHSKWDAVLVCRNSASIAKNHFGFPKPIAVKDFTDAFKNMSESIYFTFENDPYPSDIQPYVGSATIHIQFDKKLKIKKDYKLLLVLSTASIFEGLHYKEEQIQYFSKYAYLCPKTKSFTFTNVHPGRYYVYAFVDVNKDKKYKQGDFMSSNTENIIDISPETNTIGLSTIDFLIP